MPKRFSRGWLIACMLASCINAYPARQRDGKSSSFTSNFGDLSSAAASDYDFEDVSSERFVGNEDSASGEESDLVERVSSTTARNKLPLMLEPDAEMLPAHYSGVKPPGVDHMEMTFLDSASLGSNKMNNLVVEPIKLKNTKVSQSSGDETATSGSAASRGSRGKSGSQHKAIFEKSLKGDEVKEIRKGDYAEAAGREKARQETERHFKGQKNEAAGVRSASFEVDRRREKDRNSEGYHNVYHKDEYKKDADFYDNDNKGGRFHKHGHYDEKHMTSEGDFRKGSSLKSGIAEAQSGISGKFEGGRKAEEAKGTAAKSGYERFFNKFDEFAGKAAKGVGQSFDNNREAPVKVQ